MAGNNQNYARNISRKSKVFNDPIHGQIELHPVCVRIIDTPHFQRLRHIKQLDACYLVYPGASHNRFEHSIGTCHLAGKLMKALRERQPDEGIDNRDILCVEIAALCHDMGQGPFSHIFEKRFMPEMKKDFKHEKMARKMFEDMLEDNDGKVEKDIQDIIRECGSEDFLELEEKDFTFIKEMIDIPKDLCNKTWPYQGRGEEKSFMYEIVANDRNGIDVDKWDYLARDSYMLGMKINFEHDRCIMSARILKGNGSNGSDDRDGNTESGDGRGRPTVERKQICYREKNANDLYDMFYARMTLHRRAYQHKTHRIIGTMIMRALKLANDTVVFRGKTGQFSIANAVNDMEAFIQLTDDVFQVILYYPTDSSVLHSSESKAKEKNKNIDKAKKILNNILNRRLFKYVTGTQIKGISIDRDEFKRAFVEEMETCKVQDKTKFDFDVISLDYGMKNKDPMENVRFYKKESDQHSIKLKRNQVSYVLPDTFAESILSIYYWEKDQHDNKTNVELVKTVFQEWCRKKKLPLPKGTGDEDTSPKSLQTSGETNQQSSSDDRENKREAEPNTDSANEEHEDSESSSSVGGDDGTGDEDTSPKSLQTSGETTQQSSSDDRENKRLPEPNTVAPNEEHEDSESSSSVGGYDMRPSAIYESGK